MWGTHTDWPCNDWLGDFFDFSQIKFLWGKKNPLQLSLCVILCTCSYWLLFPTGWAVTGSRRNTDPRYAFRFLQQKFISEELKTLVGCQVYGFLLGVGLAQQMLVISKDVTSRSYLLFPLFPSILPNHLPSIRRGLETANLFHTWLIVK